jgi:hypothetical protein
MHRIRKRNIRGPHLRGIFCIVVITTSLLSLLHPLDWGKVAAFTVVEAFGVNSAFTTRHQRDFSRSHRDLHPNSLRQCQSQILSSSFSYLSAIKTTNDDDDEKFGWKQRLASIQCLVLGAVVGSIVQAPISFLHTTLMGAGGLAQWEYDTDMAAVTGGLFAVVYRYCIREDTNPQLKQGLLGAMILIRTLPQIHIPEYCQAVPLNCGPPLNFYILDWNIIEQLILCGLESSLLFLGTAKAMDNAMEKGYIIKFPG